MVIASHETETAAGRTHAPCPGLPVGRLTGRHRFSEDDGCLESTREEGGDIKRDRQEPETRLPHPGRGRRHRTVSGLVATPAPAGLSGEVSKEKPEDGTVGDDRDGVADPVGLDYRRKRAPCASLGGAPGFAVGKGKVPGRGIEGRPKEVRPPPPCVPGRVPLQHPEVHFAEVRAEDETGQRESGRQGPSRLVCALLRTGVHGGHRAGREIGRKLASLPASDGGEVDVCPAGEHVPRAPGGGTMPYEKQADVTRASLSVLPGIAGLYGRHVHPRTRCSRAPWSVSCRTLARAAK